MKTKILFFSLLFILICSCSCFADEVQESSSYSEVTSSSSNEVITQVVDNIQVVDSVLVDILTWLQYLVISVWVILIFFVFFYIFRSFTLF